MDPAGDLATRERLAMLGEIAVEIAHELRNVLQTISASAYVARQEMTKGNPNAALSHVAKIEKNARTAHAIVDDLMALARDEALQSEHVLLAELTVAARDDLPTDCARWEDRFEPHDLRVRVHPGLLVRLLHLLYDNAVHASAPRAPCIVTRARADERRLVIDVTDDGPGVPPDIAERVFEPLVSARPGGTGLGLPLALRIATAHGGSLCLVAGTEVGATFQIKLPI